MDRFGRAGDRIREFNPFRITREENYIEEEIGRSMRETMPIWSSDDTKNVLLASVIPGGTALIGAAAYITDKNASGWWEKLRKPKWVTPNLIKTWSVVDVCAGAPIGYASYLCYKHGGGFDYNDTRFALALYGKRSKTAPQHVPRARDCRRCCHRFLQDPQARWILAAAIRTVDRILRLPRARDQEGERPRQGPLIVMFHPDSC